MSPRHADMDYPHIPIWCDDCTQMEIQANMLREIRRQNALKDEEIRMRYAGDWTEERPRPRPRPVYVPPEPKKPEVKGGMNIEPRRS